MRKSVEEDLREWIEVVNGGYDSQGGTIATTPDIHRGDLMGVDQAKEILAELARLKSEKEAAERERDEARSQRDRLAGSLVGAIVDYDHQPYQVGDEDYERLCRRPEDGRYVLDAKAVDDIAQVEQWEEAVTWRNLVEQLTAATSRAEALEKENQRLMDGLKALKADVHWPIDFYAKNGPSVTSPAGHEYEHTDYVLAKMEELESAIDALLPPAKEVEGGK